MSFTIPKTQTAAIVASTGAPIQVKHDHPVKSQAELAPGECLVKLDCTGVCHSDLHAASGDWPLLPKTPLIGGHEGVGVIVAIGDHTTDCVEAKLSGYTIDGTFSQYVVSYVRHVTPIPDGLDSQAAASILCAGVTVYRALKYSKTTAGDWVVLPGAGGGLGHLAVQYAKNMGLKVIAIDSGAQKKKLCMDLGADVWIDFMESKNIVQDVKKATGGAGAHSAVVTATSSAGYSQAIDYLRCGGTLMVVGLPGRANLETSIFYTVYKSISILGSYVGNRQDSIEAVEIAARGVVKCYYQLRNIKDLQKTYEDLMKGMISGRVVLEFN
ncbi:hypothetical protein C0993_012050 [Termitomyces sp. T159_Od127]|nr:hypothetical protein C0993_012050 [Termitomyces sp. T159_Od127]